MDTPPIIDVTAENVGKTGFFCKMSARGKPGYERKLAWLRDRFDEGLRISMLGGGERGFVEFIPGRHAWRAVEGADDYLFIHCLWVVGKSKGKGLGRLLLGTVLETARREGYKGVATVSSAGNWLAAADIYRQHGFVSVAREGVFDILVHRFDDGADVPRFSGGFSEKTAAMGPGIVVYRSDQCPYLDDAVLHAEAFAKARAIPFRVVELTCVEDVRRLSPTPYGVFAIGRDGELVSYAYLLPKDLAARMPADA